jgi:hypothetical protein
MKIFNKAKLNNKGFGHLELLLIIVVVVAIAAAGFVVYKHSKKSTVAHAGGWTTLGQGSLCETPSPTCAVHISFTAYACEASIYGLWFVKSQVIAASAVPSGTTIDMASFSGDKGSYTANWQSTSQPGFLWGVVADSQYHQYNPKISNYIGVALTHNEGGSFTPSIRATSLVLCS